LIVSCDGLRDSKQRRLIAKVQFARALLFPELALMFLASLHVHYVSNEEPDHCDRSKREADSTD
jgi:hypothetical protein